MASLLGSRFALGHLRPVLQNSVRFQRSPNNPPERKPQEQRMKKILGRFKYRHLVMAQAGAHAHQYDAPPMPQEPVVKTVDRKLPPLNESMPPYTKYGQAFKDRQLGTWFDPLFNPHLYEDRNTVNPDEEPFNAIYVDSNVQAGDDFTKVRDITTPELWQHVERLARIRIPPEPPKRKAGSPPVPMPSGFVPPPDSPPDLPYFIARTRNYLLPVYYFLDKDPERCSSYVSRIQGDIWKLENDLRTHLESLQKPGTRILTSVFETDGQVHFRGKHIREIVNWLHAQGF